MIFAPWSSERAGNSLQSILSIGRTCPMARNWSNGWLEMQSSNTDLEFESTQRTEFVGERAIVECWRGEIPRLFRISCGESVILPRANKTRAFPN